MSKNTIMMASAVSANGHHVYEVNSRSDFNDIPWSNWVPNPKKMYWHIEFYSGKIQYVTFVSKGKRRVMSKANIPGRIKAHLALKGVYAGD